MNLNKIFKSCLLFGFLLSMTSQVSKASESAVRAASFIGHEAVNDITNFIVKDGKFCRLITMLGYSYGANILTNFINNHIVEMSYRTKQIVKTGLLTTAYIGYKLNKLSKLKN